MFNGISNKNKCIDIEFSRFYEYFDSDIINEMIKKDDELEQKYIHLSNVTKFGVSIAFTKAIVEIYENYEDSFNEIKESDIMKLSKIRMFVTELVLKTSELLRKRYPKLPSDDINGLTSEIMILDDLDSDMMSFLDMMDDDEDVEEYEDDEFEEENVEKVYVPYSVFGEFTLVFR